jgi:hypothetical protein
MSCFSRYQQREAEALVRKFFNAPLRHEATRLCLVRGPNNLRTAEFLARRSTTNDASIEKDFCADAIISFRCFVRAILSGRRLKNHAVTAVRAD